MWGGRLNHIGICIWVRLLLPPSHTSVRPPFLHRAPSKNEVPHVLIHLNKSTQHRICHVYLPSQQSANISPIMELYVWQVHHWKLPRCCLDTTNETESILTQLFSSRHGCKVWVYANDPVRVIPWHPNSLKHFCTMRDILFIVFLLFLITCRLNNPEPHNNPWPPVCIILDLWPILWIIFHCHIHRQTQIDPMTTLYLPPRYGIISTYEIRRVEELCAILIKMSTKVFNAFSPMSLMSLTLTSHISIMDPSNMPPHHI